MDALFTFLGAFIGGALAGALNWFVINKQHEHAKDLQERQWGQSEKEREKEHRLRRGDQISEWDNARTERRADRFFEINRDFANRQREAIFETQAAVAELVAISRSIYRERMDGYQNATDDQLREGSIPTTESLRSNGKVFNEVRDRLKFQRTRVDNDELRESTKEIERLAVDMVTVAPGRWETGRVSNYQGADPDILIVDLRDGFYDESALILSGLEDLERQSM